MLVASTLVYAHLLCAVVVRTAGACNCLKFQCFAPYTVQQEQSDLLNRLPAALVCLQFQFNTPPQHPLKSQASEVSRLRKIPQLHQ